MEVFREYPYLYDVPLDQELAYFETYLKKKNGFLTLCFDGKKLIGGASAVPLEDADPIVQQPFLESGLYVSRYILFIESALLPAYRGQGVGHKFFSIRETFADSLPGVRFTTFYVMSRDPGDALRLREYRSLEGFWQKRGLFLATPCGVLSMERNWFARRGSSPHEFLAERSGILIVHGI